MGAAGEAHTGGDFGKPAPAGWHGPVSAFLALAEEPFLEALTAHQFRCMNMAPDGLQVAAWRHEFAELCLRALGALAVVSRQGERLEEGSQEGGIGGQRNAECLCLGLNGARVESTFDGRRVALAIQLQTGSPAGDGCLLDPAPS